MLIESIYVCGVKYYIKELRIDESFGYCDRFHNVIELEQSLKKSKKFKTFIHEVLHAIIHEYGLNSVINDEEQLVELLTPGITELTKQLMESVDGTNL